MTACQSWNDLHDLPLLVSLTNSLKVQQVVEQQGECQALKTENCYISQKMLAKQTAILIDSCAVFCFVQPINGTYLHICRLTLLQISLN
jgi:hypothetical protein